MPNAPTAVIDTTAVSDNTELVRRKAPNSKIMAVIKANAYGHGLELAGEAMTQADGFGVARVEEAIELREAGIEKPITVLEGFIDAEEIRALLHYDLEAVFHATWQFDKLSSLVDYPSVKGWIKLDTGMNRLGLNADEFARVMQPVNARLDIVGLMSHFAMADEPNEEMTRRQMETFDAVTANYDYPASLANSAAILSLPASHRDWVRPGLMLYGVSPFYHSPEPGGLRPAMNLLAPVIAVKDVKKGDTVGYGAEWHAEADTRIAVLSIGYGDGYPREMPAGSPVLIGSERRGIVGRVSMDMICVQLEPDDRVSPGTMATLWGEGLPVEELAERVKTIPYTLMSGLTSRVKRKYI